MAKTWVDYDAYLDSRHWRKRRKQRMRTAGFRCERCGVGGRLHVHHNHYRTLYRERDRDLEVLCEQCHEDAHADDKGTADRLTREFFELVRSF